MGESASSSDLRLLEDRSVLVGECPSTVCNCPMCGLRVSQLFWLYKRRADNVPVKVFVCHGDWRVCATVPSQLFEEKQLFQMAWATAFPPDRRSVD